MLPCFLRMYRATSLTEGIHTAYRPDRGRKATFPTKGHPSPPPVSSETANSTRPSTEMHKSTPRRRDKHKEISMRTSDRARKRDPSPLDRRKRRHRTAETGQADMPQCPHANQGRDQRGPEGRDRPGAPPLDRGAGHGPLD